MRTLYGQRRRYRLLLCLASLALSSITGYLGGGLTCGVSPVAGLKHAVIVLDSRLIGGRIADRFTTAPSEDIVGTVPDSPEGAYDWLQGTAFIAIAHGLGPQLWGGQDSSATFKEGQRRGFMIFEVDVVLTRDGHLVCFHGDDKENSNSIDQLTWHEYVDRVRAKGVEPLEFAELLEWARRDSGLRFVLDVKNRFNDAYGMIRDTIGASGLGHQFIPQIYHFSQLRQFRRTPFFAGEIFTSYHSRLSTSTILERAQRLHVVAITLTRDRVDTLESIPAGVAIFTHPVNDPIEAAYLRTRGLRGIYSSYVTPRVAPEVFADWPPGCTPLTQWRSCHFGDRGDDWLAAPAIVGRGTNDLKAAART